MALIGGGGAGNVAGGNPSGIGTGLNYIGDHAYEYNIQIVNNVVTTLFEFDVGALYVNAMFQPSSPSFSTRNYQWLIYLDDQLISGVTSNSIGTDRFNFGDEIRILIPPFSKLKITVANVTDSDANNIGGVLTGRVYA